MTNTAEPEDSIPAPGTIVATTTAGGQSVHIRYARPGDAPAMLEFINTISRERTFLNFQGQQLTLAQEEEWLQGRLAAVAAGEAIYLAATAGDRVIGTSGIDRKPLAQRHVGVFGIGVARDFRGMGVGTLLMRSVIGQAEQHLAGLRIIELGVFANNELARRLYLDHGFIEYGRLPGGALHREKYVDHIQMYRPVTPGDASSSQR